jgi:hypothetical protein
VPGRNAHLSVTLVVSSDCLARLLALLTAHWGIAAPLPCCLAVVMSLALRLRFPHVKFNTVANTQCIRCTLPIPNICISLVSCILSFGCSTLCIVPVWTFNGIAG